MTVEQGQSQSLEELICGYQDWDCAKAQRVMQCESTGNPGAYAAGNIGLFQVNQIHAWRAGSVSALYEPSVNVRVAHELWSEQGWRPWAYCGTR